MKIYMIKNRKGITLIELLIVLAIIGIVITGASSMFLFGRISFSSGETQYGLQTDTRLAMESITNDIRYATKVELRNSSISSDPYETVIYFDSASNAIVKVFGGSTISSHKINSPSNSPLMFYESSSSTGNLISYVIQASENGRMYDISADLLLLNTNIVTGGTSGSALAFLTPSAYHAKELAPTVVFASGVTNTSSTTVLNYSKPTFDYGSNIGVAVTAHKISAANITVSRTNIAGLMSQLTVSVVQAGNVGVNQIQNKDRIELKIYNAGVSSPTDDDIQYFVNLVYNSSSGLWEIS